MHKNEEKYRAISRITAIIESILRNVLFVAIVAVVLYKIYISPLNFSNIDFSDLISLILAIFSISLSVMFYLKANDTSNQFYDNTYKFTQDVSIILGRIEAGFGERLKHIDEGYQSISDVIYHSVNISDTEAKIEKKEKEIIKVNSEREKIIQDLLKKSQIIDFEKEKIANALKEKSALLEKTQNELTNISKTLATAETEFSNEKLKASLVKYLEVFLKNRNFRTNWGLSEKVFREKFYDEISSQIDKGWISDCKKIGLIDDLGHITNQGSSLFREILMKYSKGGD